MIFPTPTDLHDFKKIPLTVTVVCLNIFLFVILFSGSTMDRSFDKVVSRENLKTTAHIYKEYQLLVSQQDRSILPSTLVGVDSRDEVGMKNLAIYALRDGKFLEQAPTMTFSGDQIAISKWKAVTQEYLVNSKDQVLFRFGLSTESSLKRPLSWITYQFAHSNWFHLFTNMVFLFAMGAAVEVLAGSGVLLAVYLIGGVAGGMAFIGSQSHGIIPMVGASAAVSAIMAFYLVAEPRRNIRYFYLFTPFKGGYGAIYLPVILLLPLYLLSDLTATLATVEGMGSGIAYVAHLGGSFSGVLLGFCHRIAQSRSVIRS